MNGSNIENRILEEKPLSSDRPSSESPLNVRAVPESLPNLGNPPLLKSPLGVNFSALRDNSAVKNLDFASQTR
jgi:hypothetical protein